MIIFSPPKVVRVHPDENHAQINEGDELEIKCDVSGFPKPDIFWSRKVKFWIFD